MSRTKIDYGIDLGTTNSAISRMENGTPVIKKTDTLKDTMPSCVYVNKKKSIQVGDSAYNALKRAKLAAIKNWNIGKDNAFIEFKRTMGSDETYESSNLGKKLTPEELSAEVLKTLKSFVKDENVNSVVITVPAAFKSNQIDATRRAGNLAGFEHVEVLQEPVAASLAYGLDSKNKDGLWLVFDFGGGTFDAALLQVEEGIMKVIDTEGDNYLGGKDLDYAIVDKIILPYLQENHVIDDILNDDNQKQILRNSMKFYAEETKIKLSFNDEHNILSDLGDIPGEDDDGEEFELDIVVTQSDMERALAPIFQKAINAALALLKRNNSAGSSLASLILVGGPTFSPVLRKMLASQICTPDTSADPMTVVSKGAALYASTVDISSEVRDKTRDTSKIQLEIDHEASTVEKEEFVTLKILEDKTEGNIPEKVFAEVTRGDKAWSSGKIEIDTVGAGVEVVLNEGKANIFEVVLYDVQGNLLENEPNNFSIIQGIGGIGSMQTLPYSWGVQIKRKAIGRAAFTSIPGLERNKPLPLIGIKDDLKTQKQIRPGIDADFIKIPLYQGEHEADGSRAIYNEHVYDIIITGADLPALLPEGSTVELTLKIDKSQNVTAEAYFPYLEYTEEIEVPTNTKQSSAGPRLQNEILKAKEDITELKEKGTPNAELTKLENEIQEHEDNLNNAPNDAANQMQVLSNLRKSLKKVDNLQDNAEWPYLEKQLKEDFYKLEKANSELGNEQTTLMVNQIRTQLEEVLQAKDPKIGAVFSDDINRFFVQLTLIYQLMGFINHHHENFNSFGWKDSNQARTLLNEGRQKISENAQADVIHPIVISLLNLLPEESRPSGDNEILTD